MPNKKTWTCPGCEEKFEAEPEDTYEAFDGKRVCEGCHDSGFQRASKLYKFAPGEDFEEVIFDEDFNYSEPGEEAPAPVKRQKYVQSDGWRGYTDWELLPGYIEYAEGWITGYPDDTTKRKAELADYFNDLYSGELEPPCPIYWIFGHTSNVFSQTSSIVIKETDKPLIDAWISEINGGPEEFKNKFK